MIQRAAKRVPGIGPDLQQGLRWVRVVTQDPTKDRSAAGVIEAEDMGRTAGLNDILD